jgi:hypothetical protein
MPDVDLDFFDRDKVLAQFKHVTASRLEKQEVKKHNTGVYFHNAPVQPFTGLCTIDHKEADERGYFKIDMLNVHIYEHVRDEEHLNTLLEKEPLWELLTEPDFSNKLFHVAEHSTILKSVKPTSIQQLAAVLAMIRPAKRHLIGKQWPDIMKEVWTKPTDGSYYFKKAHAVAYAHAIVVHMNLLCEQVSAQQP